MTICVYSLFSHNFCDFSSPFFLPTSNQTQPPPVSLSTRVIASICSPGDGWGQHPTYSRHVEALTLVRKARRGPAHISHTAPGCRPGLSAERTASGIFMPLLNSTLWTSYGVCYSAEICHLLPLLLLLPYLQPDTFGIGPWDILVSIRRTQRNRGPIDTSAFNPLFCSGKAGRGRKFKHEDSVQIAVTLAREEGESRLEEGKWITVTSTTGANPAFLSIKFPFMLFIKKITKGKLSHTGRVSGWSVYSLNRCLSNNKSIETHLSKAGSLKFQLWNRARVSVQ